MSCGAVCVGASWCDWLCGVLKMIKSNASAKGPREWSPPSDGARAHYLAVSHNVYGIVGLRKVGGWRSWC